MHQDDPINSESDQFCSKPRVFWPQHVVTLIQRTTQHLVRSDRHSIDTLQSSSGKDIETFASLTRIAIQLDADSQPNRTFQANEPVRLNTAVVKAPRPPTVSYPTLSAWFTRARQVPSFLSIFRRNIGSVSWGTGEFTPSSRSLNRLMGHRWGVKKMMWQSFHVCWWYIHSSWMLYFVSEKANVWLTQFREVTKRWFIAIVIVSI